MKPFAPLLLCVLAFLLPACRQPPTAAGSIAANATANPALIATAQADQYARDAQATTYSRQLEAVALTATYAADLRHVQSTAQSAASTATAALAQATATTAYQQTADTLTLSLTAGAATSQAQATATSHARQDAQSTATAASQATTASFNTTRQAFELQQAQSTAHRQTITTAALTAFLVFTATLTVGLAVWFFFQVAPTLANRAAIIRYGQHGNPLLLLQRNGRTVITDPLAMLQAAAIVDQDAGVTMPELTPDALQSYVAAGRLRLLMEQARHAPGHPTQLPAEITTQRRLGPLETSKTVRHGRPSVTTNPPTLLAAGGSPSFEDEGIRFPAAVSWQQLATWPGPGLALGAGPQQRVVALDLARTPHLFVAGMSGSGKTRRLLRPLVAQALAGGYYAVLLNESGADFSPFYHHPNVTIVRGGAAHYAAVLEAAMGEVGRREGVLRAAGVSEWGRLSAGCLSEQPFLLLAIDELLALAMVLAPAEQREFWGLLAAFASRARKVGMGSVGLATDPTYRALGQGGLNYRSQCGRVSFRMMQAAGSRAVLDEVGAEALGDGQFLALLERPGVIHGVTANPDDDELRAYLTQRPIPTLLAPTWAETGEQQDTETSQPPPFPLPPGPVAALAQQIRPLWAQMQAGELRYSKSALAAHVNQRYAGAWTRKIDDAIAYLESTSTATSTWVFLHIPPKRYISEYLLL